VAETAASQRIPEGATGTVCPADWVFATTKNGRKTMKFLVTTKAHAVQQGMTSAIVQATHLKLVSGFSVAGQERYAAIWEKSNGPEFVARHGLSAQAYQQEFDHWVGQGFRLRWVSGYSPIIGAFTNVADMGAQPGQGQAGGGRWYPTLCTLPSGAVLAFQGHPKGYYFIVLPLKSEDSCNLSCASMEIDELLCLVEGGPHAVLRPDRSEGPQDLLR
jgi:hypothetical protein